VPSQCCDHGKEAALLPKHRCKLCPTAGGGGLIVTENTEIITKRGIKKNGNLLYTLVPMQVVTQAYYDRQFAKADLAAAQQKAKAKAEKLGIQFIPAGNGQSA